MAAILFGFRACLCWNARETGLNHGRNIMIDLQVCTFPLHLKDPKSISSCSKRWLACCDSCWLLRLWWSWDHSPPAIASSSRSGATQPARHCHGVPCCSTPCQVPPLSAALTPRSGASRRPSEEQGDWIEDPFLPFLDEWLLDGSYMVHGWLIAQSQPSESSLWISSETKTMFIEWNHGWLMDSWWFSPCWLTWFFMCLQQCKTQCIHD